jgi:hypothetical protein
MNYNQSFRSDASVRDYLHIKCAVPNLAVKPIVATIEAFGAYPTNINDAGIIVRSVPALHAGLLEACVRIIAGLYPDAPPASLHLFHD